MSDLSSSLYLIFLIFSSQFTAACHLSQEKNARTSLYEAETDSKHWASHSPSQKGRKRFRWSGLKLRAVSLNAGGLISAVRGDSEEIMKYGSNFTSPLQHGSLMKSPAARLVSWIEIPPVDQTSGGAVRWDQGNHHPSYYMAGGFSERPSACFQLLPLNGKSNPNWYQPFSVSR